MEQITGLRTAAGKTRLRLSHITHKLLSNITKMAETTLHVEKMRGLLLLHMGGVGRASSRGRVTQPTSSSRGAFDPGAGKASCYTGYILHQASAQSPEQWQKKGEKGKKKKKSGPVRNPRGGTALTRNMVLYLSTAHRVS